MLRLQHGILIVIPRRSKAPTWESQPLIYRLNKDIKKIGGDCHGSKRSLAMTFGKWIGIAT